MALPVSSPPVMSAALIPETVYGTEVPDATLVVVRVNVAVEPSLHDSEEMSIKVGVLEGETVTGLSPQSEKFLRSGRDLKPNFIVASEPIYI